jgi:hypothetical protein
MYTHIENNHEIYFADEKDYLRCKLEYLEDYTYDVSGPITFTFFVDRRLYDRSQVRVLEVKHIETHPSQQNYGREDESGRNRFIGYAAGDQDAGDEGRVTVSIPADSLLAFNIKEGNDEAFLDCLICPTPAIPSKKKKSYFDIIDVD